MSRYTPEDVQQIAAFIRHAKDRRPFALLTGAGCSKAAGIPLAGELVEEINSTPCFEPALQGLQESDRQNYGRVMACLGRNDRKGLLSPYLEGAKVNWAHIAIAAMIGAGYISRVLTFNFDNVLARACGICGIYPATYDFVTGASSSTDHIVSPAIVHLHGQGYGLSMLNSEAETAVHAEKMRPLLQSTMRSFPLLVVGYSGLADRVFPLLRDEYKGDERLFWAGYSEDPQPHVNGFINKGDGLTKYLGGADADLFLVQIAQQIGCWPPIIFENPVEHIRREILPITDFPTDGGMDHSPGIDVLVSLRFKLDMIEGDPTAHDPASRASINMLKGDFDSVIRSAEEGDEIPEELLVDAYLQAGVTLARKAEAASDASLFEAAVEKFAAALKIKPDSHEALNNWGNSLSNMAEVRDEVSLFDAAGEKYAMALKIKPDMHEALSNWGNALSGKANVTGEASLFDAAGEKYAAALKLKPDKYEALDNWGLALLEKAEATGDASMLDAAGEKFAAALKIRPEGAYNMACLCALLGDEAGARRHLETCHENRTLPTANHMATDSDLDSLRELDWFKALLEQARETERKN